MTSREALRRLWPYIELIDHGGRDELRVGSSVAFRVFATHYLYEPYNPGFLEFSTTVVPSLPCSELLEVASGLGSN
jgi:hypothetical protein